MKNKILSGIVLMTILVMPSVGLAKVSALSGMPDAPGWNSTSFLKILDDIFNALFYILLIAAAIGIVVAGIYFVTASGDSDKTKTARNFVVYSLVGVLVGFLAKAMIAFVNSIVK